MSSYRLYGPTVQLNAVAVSGTNTYTTAAVDISSFQSASYQAEWTGNISGTINILGSNDNVNFRQFGATATAPTGAGTGGSVTLLYGVPLKYIQFQYVNATGTGTLTVTTMGKSR